MKRHRRPEPDVDLLEFEALLYSVGSPDEVEAREARLAFGPFASRFTEEVLKQMAQKLGIQKGELVLR